MQFYSGVNVRVTFVLFMTVFTFRFAEINAQCEVSTPSFTVNLVGSPSGTYTSPNTTRTGSCCGGIISGECVKFTISLDPNAIGINFGFASGAQPPGALFYQINCGPTSSVGTPICLNGAGPHILTFCKPGGNANTYSITSIPKPNIPDSIMVRDGCSQTLTATGFSVPTINWVAVGSSVGSNTIYNTYLSCTTGCSLTVVTPTGSPPAWVDYEVSGFAASPCQANFYRDTVRVYFFSNLLAAINPTTICFGSISAALVPTVSGGKPAYTYSWSTGSTSPSVTVGAGTYTLRVFDQTGCPPTMTTVVVSNFTLPITAIAGPDQTLCKSSPNAALNGSIVSASGGVWSGGSGTFTPATNSLSVSYIPTGAEVTGGSVQLYLTTTGNAGCPPGKDTVNIFFQNQPTITAGPDRTVCANNNVVALSGSVTGYSSTVIWSGAGTGSFTSITSSNTAYTPGPAEITSGSVNVIVTTTNNGACPPAKDTVKVIITPAPVVNAGPDFTVCSINAHTLAGTVSGTFTGLWISKGSGTFVPNNTVLNAQYLPGPGDVATGSVEIVLQSANIGNCLIVRDSLILTINHQPTVNAGPNQRICSNASTVALSGSVSGVSSTGSWLSNGSGGFGNSNTVSTVYTISPADITAGTVAYTLTSTNNGACPAVSDSVMIRIDPVAVVNAGFNANICSTQGLMPLNGTISGASGTGVWSTGGAGQFTPSNTSLSTSYSITQADAIAGTVIFSLTSTGNGVCPAVSDTVMMRVSVLASVTAMPNMTLCSNINTLSLTGTITGGSSSGQWTTNGSGSFANSGSVTTIYTITPADKTAGSVNFTLTSTNNGVCSAVSNTVALSISPIATVNAGPNLNICSTQTLLPLNGIIFGASGTGSWSSTGTGAYTPTNSILSTSYTTTQTDIVNGLIIFTLTSTGNGVCPSVSDTVLMRITQQPTVTASPNRTLCSNINTVSLSGTITGVTSTGQWTTSGSGSFVNSNSVSTTYSISTGDKTTGLVIFTLTSANNNTCVADSKTLSVTISPIATVNAGPNLNICSTQSNIPLNGFINGAAGTGIWSSQGTGAITPTNNILNTSYSVTTADVNNGLITFTLTSTGNGTCPAVSDTVVMRITKQPTVTASSSRTLCSNINSMALSGTVTGVTNTGQWTTSGSGAFTNGSSLTTTYNISQADKTNGQVTFTLTSTNNGTCQADVKTVNLMINKLATVTAGPKGASFCSSQGSIPLLGSSSTSSGTWSAAGSGPFSPGNNVTSPTYSLTNTDILTGQVTFSYTSVNNGTCPAVTDTVKIRIVTMPTVKAGTYQPICTVTPSLALSGTVTGGSNSAIWSSATSGTNGFAPSPLSMNATYSVNAFDKANGKIIFSLTPVNSSPCPFINDVISVSVVPLPIVGAGSYTPVCADQKTIGLNGSITGGAGTVSWTASGTGSFVPGNNSAVTAYSFTTQDINSGIVGFTVTSTNLTGCPPVSQAVNVTLKNLILDAGTSKTICSNQQNVAITGTVSGVTNTGVWITDGHGSFLPGNQPVTNYVVSSQDITKGNLIFVLSSTGHSVCPVKMDTIYVKIITKPAVSLKSDTSICDKQVRLRLNAFASGGSGNYLWTTSGTGSFLPNNYQTISNYNTSAGDRSAGTVTLTFSSVNNGPCGDVSASMRLKLLPAPLADFSASTYTIQIPSDPVTLTNLSKGADSYTWTFGDGLSSNEFSPVKEFTEVGYYKVTLYANSNNGCKDTVDKQFTVISDVKFPNAFTPDLKGPRGGQYSVTDFSNDVFFPYAFGVVEYNLMIFNRWGELIFQSEDINIGWDGYFNGVLCQQDVYVWKTNMKFFDGRTFEKTGSVTLLR